MKMRGRRPWRTDRSGVLRSKQASAEHVLWRQLRNHAWRAPTTSMFTRKISTILWMRCCRADAYDVTAYAACARAS